MVNIMNKNLANKELRKSIIKWLDGKSNNEIADRIISIVNETVESTPYLLQKQIHSKIIKGFAKYGIHIENF